MNNDKIKEIIVEKTEELRALCYKISPDYDIQIIHEFRVGFKYLRSFLRLIRMHNDNRGLKLPEKLKDLYYIAGGIRDIQIELKNIAEQQLELPDFNNTLEKSLLTEKKDWDKYYSDKILQQFAKKGKQLSIEELPAGVLTNFLNTRMASIDVNINDHTPTDVQMHNVRKHAKDIIYATNASKKKNLGVAKEEIKAVPLKELNRVADKIGNYNDDRLHLEYINQFSADINASPDKEKIDQINNEQKPIMEKQKRNIVKLIKNLLVKKP